MASMAQAPCWRGTHGRRVLRLPGSGRSSLPDVEVWSQATGQLTLNSPVAPFEASLNLWVTKG